MKSITNHFDALSCHYNVADIHLTMTRMNFTFETFKFQDYYHDSDDDHERSTFLSSSS